MFNDFGHIAATILAGLPATLAATVGGVLLTIPLSFAAGLALLSKHRWVRFISRVYVEGLRGTSEVVQLFWIYFVLPALIGFQLVPLWAGILVLGLNHGAYGAEIVRGAVQSVPQPQHEGAIALNLTATQRMWRVILPQAVVEMIPPFNNLFIQLMKSTALLSFITVTEIANQGEILRPQFGSQLLLIYLVELVLYLLIALLITAAMRLLERITARNIGRRPIPRTGLLARAIEPDVAGLS
ncbi:ectoine/hydroxyectoine ABC transporter permease subunit EhuC [Fodinicola acaciae]|uniref:ectoine/hydroxyectoine ABC transporter permease subunit EhuC n=1 Tax=Fodinicola acaciae TaxID=2681555 RepID=UPI0013D51764|nr:ectoine/hydroxyectoine ABC transporter permease subunit EhuC [Fodinicola acaciae]